MEHAHTVHLPLWTAAESMHQCVWLQVQAVLFDARHGMSDIEAARWWEGNKGRFERVAQQERVRSAGGTRTRTKPPAAAKLAATAPLAAPPVGAS